MTLERDLLRTFQRKPAPPGFADRVLEQLERQARVDRRVSGRTRSFAWLAAVAATVMLAVGGVQHYRNHQAIAEAARVQEDVRLALQITGEKLALVQRKLHERHR